MHPYRWLRSDLVPPAPFLVCDPGVTTGGSGILVEPHAIDEQFRRAWMPFFCRGDRGTADLDAFRAVAEDLVPLLLRSGFLLSRVICYMMLFWVKALLLGAWMAGAGESSRPCLWLGLRSWLVSSL